MHNKGKTAYNAKYNNPDFIGKRFGKLTWARIKRLGWNPEDALTIAMNETRKWKRSERFCKKNTFSP